MSAKNKTELDRKVVRRNGVDIEFVKVVGAGNSAREHWEPVLESKESILMLIEWIGEDHAHECIIKLQEKINTATYSGGCREVDDEGNDLGPDIDANFEAFVKKERLVARSSSVYKHDEARKAKLQVLKLKGMLLNKGATEDEINEVLD